MQTFTLIFLAALLLSTLMQLWLAQRHVRHIQAHRDSVPADFSSQIDLPAHQKAADYSVAKTRLGIAHTLLDALILLAFTLGGGLQMLADFWQGIFNAELLRGAALIMSALAIFSILEMPLNLYHSFGVDARFGFNKLTPRLFITDLIKHTLLALALGLPLVLGVLWLMNAMGAQWWLYVWLAWMGFNLVIMAVYPAFIAPLFNKFTPLEDDTLKTRIDLLLQKCGFKSQGLFVMDGSTRSTHGNAYFTGFGRTKRIVFFDTLLQRLDHDEIEAVLAHELGHFKRRHIVKRLAWMFAMSLAGLWLLGYFMQQPWFFSGLGATAHTAAMALMLFLLASPVFTFLLHPLSSLYSRKHEFEADQYASQVSSAHSLIKALVKLYQDNASTLTPDPLHSAFYDSHPPAAMRIAHLQNAAHN